MYKCFNCNEILHKYEGVCPSCWRCQTCKQRTMQESYICLFCDLQKKYCPLLDSLISRQAQGCEYCSGVKICKESIPDHYIEQYDKHIEIPIMWWIGILSLAASFSYFLLS